MGAVSAEGVPRGRRISAGANTGWWFVDEGTRRRLCPRPIASPTH